MPKPMKHPERQIASHYHTARALALSRVEEQARSILAAHSRLDEFIMAMGVWMFTDRNGENINDLAYMRPLAQFIDEWDDVLKLTGSPMRFTATGRRVTDW